MIVQVIAQSDRSIYVARGDDSRYVVFSTSDTAAIALGHFLSHPRWDDSGGFDFTVWNATKVESLTICLENWSLEREAAFSVLKMLDEPHRIEELRDSP